jgi:hypothetical protein
MGIAELEPRQLVSELSVQGHLIKTKDEQIANLQKQLDQNNGSA